MHCRRTDQTAGDCFNKYEFGVLHRRWTRGVEFVSRIQPPHYLLSWPSLFLGKELIASWYRREAAPNLIALALPGFSILFLLHMHRELKSRSHPLPFIVIVVLRTATAPPPSPLGIPGVHNKPAVSPGDHATPLTQAITTSSPLRAQSGDSVAVRQSLPCPQYLSCSMR
jgi:hypothetical protein